MSGQQTNRDPELDAELGEQVEAAPRRQRGTTLVAVRLSADLLERVDEYARVNSLTLSEVLRQGAERVVSGTLTPGPFIVSATFAMPASGQAQAVSSGGQGRSEQLAGFGESRELTLAG